MASPAFTLLLTTALLCLSSPAEAGRWEFGLGVSNADDSTVKDSIPALRASARMERGAFGLFSNIMVRPDGLNQSVSGLTETVLRISTLTVENNVPTLNLFKERGVIAIGADWSFGNRSPVANGLSGGPRLYVELEARLREAGNVTYREDAVLVTNNKLNLNVGPAIGASVDVWMNQTVGLRIGVESRLSYEKKTFVPVSEIPDPPNGVRNRFGLTVDLLFGTGGEE